MRSTMIAVSLLTGITLLAACGSPSPTATGPVPSTATSTDGVRATYSPRDVELTATAIAENKTAFPITSTAVLDGAVPASGFPLPFPPGVPGEGQIAAARACDIHALYAARYQEVTEDALPGVAPPESACDWAALAFAYGFRYNVGQGKPFPEAGDRAFFTAIDGNPALMYLAPIAEHYLLAGGVVGAPPQTAEPLNTIVINGLVSIPTAIAAVDITISGPSTSTPTLSGTYRLRQVVNQGGTPSIQETETPLSGPADAGAVMALVNALTDLVPISAELPSSNCGGIEYAWAMEYRYASGTVITVKGDTLWQANIDGQQYLQYGPDLPTAINLLTTALEIPVKAGAGTYCMETALIDLAFPAE